MDKIKLRPMEPEDLDILYNIENDMELWSVGYTTAPYSRYLLHDYIANNTSDIYADRQMRLIAENVQGEVVGIVDITNFEPQHNRAEIGLVTRRKYRRQGYGLKMVDAIKAYSLRTIHLHQLFAVVSEDNDSSLELFMKCGFEHSALLKEWLFDGKKYQNAVLLTYFL